MTRRDVKYIIKAMRDILENAAAYNGSEMSRLDELDSSKFDMDAVEVTLVQSILRELKGKIGDKSTGPNYSSTAADSWREKV
jgi:hypothetical protein